MSKGLGQNFDVTPSIVTSFGDLPCRKKVAGSWYRQASTAKDHEAIGLDAAKQLGNDLITENGHAAGSSSKSKT